VAEAQPGQHPNQVIAFGQRLGAVADFGVGLCSVSGYPTATDASFAM
jgi:hypothetical protein